MEEFYSVILTMQYKGGNKDFLLSALAVHLLSFSLINPHAPHMYTLSTHGSTSTVAHILLLSKMESVVDVLLLSLFV